MDRPKNYQTKIKPKEKETNDMKELEIDPALAARTLSNLKRSNSEVGALKGLTSMINSPEFGEDVQDSSDGKFSAPTADEAGTLPSDPMPRQEPTPLKTKGVLTAAAQPPKPAPVVAAPSRVSFPDRIFTTGKLMSGKDHFLAAIGCAIHGFAEPLYALQHVFFGDCDKTAPGAREFLQAIGQWGRGTINEKYPITAARATFVTMIRMMAPGGLVSKSLRVQWENYGKDENLWVNALIERISEVGGPGQRVGVSNVRFQNEFDRLKAEGFSHFHVMCSPKTWTNRLAKAGKSTTSAAVSDISEQMAIAFDKSVAEQIKKQPRGPKLRVIWNDQHVACPSPRLISLADIAASTNE